jgi:endoglycosylceramidase
MFARLAALVAAVPLLITPAMSVASAEPPTPVPAAGGAIATPLHVDGTRLRDATGRDVILRGINLGRKSAPYLPDVSDADLARIRSLGINQLRLYTSWQAVMPSRGQVDTAYLARFRGLVDRAGAAGLLVTVDMHQDLYGKPAGNGAPLWAYQPGLCPQLPLAQLTGAWGADYFSPAVDCAFTSFWTSKDLQARFADAWVAVARAVGDAPNVIGYDLFNEPFPGLIPPVVFETTYLFPSQARWLSAIRTVDPDAVGFIEPNVIKSETVVEVPPVGLMPPNSVYAPHLYGPWDLTSDIPLLEQTRILADAAVASSRLAAGLAKVPLWIGEWGVFSGAGGASDFVTHVYDMADDALAGAALWEYTDPGYGPFRADGSPTPIRDAVRRPYPQAVPGTLRRIDYAPATRRLSVSWVDAPAGTASLQVPSGVYPDGITVTGASDWSWDRASGVLTAAVVPGSGTLTVTPRAS